MAQLTRARLRRRIVVAVVTLAVAAGAAGEVAWTPGMPSITPPDPASFATTESTCECAVCWSQHADNGKDVATRYLLRARPDTVLAC